MKTKEYFARIEKKEEKEKKYNSIRDSCDLNEEKVRGKGRKKYILDQNIGGKKSQSFCEEKLILKKPK